MKKLCLILFLTFFCFNAFAKNYRPIDSRAEQVPAQYEKSLPELVNYLTEPYQKDDESKARVLLAWIVHHVDYDEYKADDITKFRHFELSPSISY